MIVSIYFEFENKRNVLATIEAENIDAALNEAKRMFQNKNYFNALKAIEIKRRNKNGKRTL